MLNVSGIYKPPHLNIKDFSLSFYESFISKIPINCKYILAGDFNINVFNPLNLDSINGFIQTMMGNNFMMYITRATKHNPNNSITEYAFIDHIWCNFRPIDMKTGVILTHITDHFSIFIDFKTKVNKLIEKINFRDFSDRNKRIFIDRVNQLNFYIDNRTRAHLNSSFNSFYNIFFEIFDSSMSKRCKTKMRGSYAPWMTPDLRFCIQKKYRLLKQVNLGRLSRSKFNE